MPYLSSAGPSICPKDLALYHGLEFTNLDCSPKTRRLATFHFLEDVEAHLLGGTRFARAIYSGDAEHIATRGETLE